LFVYFYSFFIVIKNYFVIYFFDFVVIYFYIVCKKELTANAASVETVSSCISIPSTNKTTDE
jgi:hypothetical protein